MVNDQVSDLLTRIRNAQRAGQRSTSVSASKMGRRVLDVLKREGLIESFEDSKTEGVAKLITVFLKYYSSGRPVIGLAKRISTPGCRKYCRVDDIPRVLSGLGVAIVSTSKGVVSDREARKLKVGGEVLALVG